MRKILVLFVLAVTLFTLIGCNNSDGKGVTHIYSPIIHWNDTDYCAIADVVTVEDIGEQVNIIRKIVKRSPKKNCETNGKFEVGSKLYRIKNQNITEAIAIEYNNSYVKAVNIEQIDK